MFQHIENLKIEDIHKGVSKKSLTVANRKSSSMILRTGGHSRHTFQNESIELRPGEMIFLPKGSSYSFTPLSDAPCEYLAVRFEADLTDARPFSFSIDRFEDADGLTHTLTDLWKFGGRSEHYKCYAMFYNLLSYAETLEHLTYMEKKKLHLLSPALSYLKNHIYDCDLKMDALYQCCGISGAYFRKIFQSGYAMSPQKYILKKRLSRAKTMMDHGDYDSISDIAYAVGYNDPLYFSRAFKKAYGVSPSQYAKG